VSSVAPPGTRSQGYRGCRSPRRPGSALGCPRCQRRVWRCRSRSQEPLRSSQPPDAGEGRPAAAACLVRADLLPLPAVPIHLSPGASWRPLASGLYPRLKAGSTSPVRSVSTPSAAVPTTSGHHACPLSPHLPHGRSSPQRVCLWARSRARPHDGSDGSTDGNGDGHQHTAAADDGQSSGAEALLRGGCPHLLSAWPSDDRPIQADRRCPGRGSAWWWCQIKYRSARSSASPHSRRITPLSIEHA
jgi:hypothetical protein